MRPTSFLIGLLVCAVLVGSPSVRADDDDGATDDGVASSAEPVNLDVLVDEDVVEVLDDGDGANGNDDGDGSTEAVDPVATTAVLTTLEAKTTQEAPQEKTASSRSGKYMSYDDYLNGNLDMGTDTVGDPNYNYGEWKGWTIMTINFPILKYNFRESRF